jgi:hypothetical protein
VLLRSSPAIPERGDATLKFFDWALTNGQQAAENLDYVPLPAAVVDEVRAQLRTRIKSLSDKALLRSDPRGAQRCAVIEMHDGFLRPTVSGHIRVMTFIYPILVSRSTLFFARRK